MWSELDQLQLRRLTIDPHRRNQDELAGLVAHFKEDGTIFSVTQKGKPVRASQEFARKVRRLTLEGKLDWVLGITFETSSSTGRESPSPLAAMAAQDHYAELVGVGRRLRDKMFIQSASVLINNDHFRSLDVWEGEPRRRCEEAIPASIDEAVGRAWGSGITDQRQHQIFTLFRSHLRSNPCWETLDRLAEAWADYGKLFFGLLSLVGQAFEKHAPDLEDEIVGLAEMAVLDAVLKGFSRDPILGLRDLPDFLRPPARALLLNETPSPSLVSWREHYFKVLRLASKWRKQLGPDPMLRKAIAAGTCEACPA